jgi:hypothetical protein
MLLLRDRSNVNLASNFRHFRGPLRAEIFGSSFVRALFPYKPRLISLWLSFSAFFRQPDEGSSSAGTLPRGIATSARLVISRTKVRSLFHSWQSFELKVLIFIRRCLCTVQSSDASTSWRTVQPDPSLPISPTASTFSVACGPFSRGYCSQGSNCPHPHLRTSPFSPPSFPPPSLSFSILCWPFPFLILQDLLSRSLRKEKTPLHPTASTPSSPSPSRSCTGSPLQSLLGSPSTFQPVRDWRRSPSSGEEEGS